MSLSGIGEVANFVGGIVDRFFPPDATPEQKAAATLALSQEVAERDKAKASIIVSEMAQGDNYTKRARPTVVYGGLIMIAINYVIFPMVGRLVAFAAETPERLETIKTLVEPLNLPGEFWMAWGGVVGTWVLGRSYEKAKGSGGGNLERLQTLITGK